MLTPQEKVVIVSPRTAERAVIETLYRLRTLHIVEFHEGRDTHGLRFGRPLPEGSKASERLVRLRALVRNLGLEGASASRATPAADVERRVDQALTHLEVNVQSAVESRDRVRQALKDLDERETRLRPLSALPLRVEDYRGYESLRVFVGEVAEPLTDADLGPLREDSVLFQAGKTVALFVPVKRADVAQDVLARKGFRDLEVPTGEGSPADVLAAAASDRKRLGEKLEAVTAELARLGREHGDFLLAAEEHLAIEVEKAEAPLSFGSTEYAFVVTAWVPTDEVHKVEDALRAAVGDDFHLERSSPDTHAEAHHAPAETADAQTVPGEAEAKPEHHEEELPPTKYRNPAYARPFEYFTSMFATPRYGEVDPTLVLTFAFPLFYGFMIGDLGYGLIMLGLGVLLVRKVGHVEGMRQLGVAIAVAGIVASSLGAFVFYDAFGIPFYPHGPHAEHAHSCAEFAALAGETAWQCILTGTWSDHPPHALISKIQDVSTLLVLSVLAAVVHLTLGLLFGIANERKHSMKHALAKVGWLALLLAFTYQIVSVARYNKMLGAPLWFRGGETVGYPDGAVAHGMLGLRSLAFGAIEVVGLEVSYLVLGLVLGGLALLVVTEGGIALLEIPSLLANILSYTRLAGVAVAKAAMAAAFNSLFLVGMVMEPGAGILLILVGGVLVVVTQLVVLVLGLLSSGIQAIRLNYVEFFTKFYKGGGVPFKPFGRERRFSLETVRTHP